MKNQTAISLLLLHTNLQFFLAILYFSNSRKFAIFLVNLPLFKCACILLVFFLNGPNAPLYLCTAVKPPSGSQAGGQDTNRGHKIISGGGQMIWKTYFLCTLNGKLAP